MPSPFTTDMETNSQYSSCETLDSHRSSECDEKSEVNGNSEKKTRKISAEHTDYIVKERVTRKEPPKPAYNPMQFVAMKPSNLFHTAQEQIKKAEEIKKVQKESTIKKEEPEDWQNNLDNWKSSRRKRVEHIIDRVVEVKKLEEEEHDRNRRSIKTFSELMEERGSRRKLSTLAIYTEEDSTFDMNDLTPMSDENGSSDKMKTNSDNNSDKKKQASDTTDDVFNNNNNNENNDNGGSGNLHSTALIKDVIHKKQQQQQPEAVKEEEPKTGKSRVVGGEEKKVAVVKTEVKEQITTDLSRDDGVVYEMSVSAKVTTTTSQSATKTSLRSLDARERDYTYDDAIEDYKTRVSQAAKLDLPKIDLNKRRELFEQQSTQAKDDESSNISTAAAKLGTEIVSIKERISSLRNNLVTNGAVSSSSASSSSVPPKKIVDVAVSTTIKDRLSSLHQQVSSPVDEASKRILDTPFKNVHEARNEFELKQQQHLLPQSSVSHTRASEESTLSMMANDESQRLSDHDDSGINEHYQTRPDVIQHESIIAATAAADEEDNDLNEEEESSVSFRNEQIQSMVMVLSLNENNNNNSTTNNNSSNSNSVATDAAAPISPARKSIAMMNFIHSNYQPFDGDEADNNDGDLHNTTTHANYAYEAIEKPTTQRNELEKSNSVDTAISLCSSSDGTNLTDDCAS